MNKKEEWYLRTTQGDSFNKVGRKSGLYPSTISKAAAKGWKLSAETVIAIALAYHADPQIILVLGISVHSLIFGRKIFHKSLREGKESPNAIHRRRTGTHQRSRCPRQGNDGAVSKTA